MGSTECESKSVLEWLVTYVTLGIFIQLWWGKSWALRHMTQVCSVLPKSMLACGKDRMGHNFPSGTQHALGPLTIDIPGVPQSWRSGGLFSHQVTSDKNRQRLATTPYNNNICNGSRSHKRHNTAEILPFSFPSATEWNILAAILKACSILLDAEGAFPSVPLQPGPGQGLLCHCAPTASVERQPCGLARTSPHFSTPISISSLLHAPKFSACKSLWRGLSNFHGAPSEHWVSGLFFFPSFPRLHSWWQGLAQCIKTISYLFIMGKDTCICNWFDRRQHDSCFTGFSIEIANERLAGIYGTYLYPKQKGNNIHSDKPCLYTAFSKFVPSAGSQPSSGLVQSGTAPPTPRQLHQFTPRKKWGIIFSVTHQNYKRWGGGEGKSSDLQEGWRRAASQAATCWRGIDLGVFARLGLWICGGGCNKDRNILEATQSCLHPAWQIALGTAAHCFQPV